MVNRKRKKIIQVQNEIILSPISLNHEDYLHTIKSTINKREWSLFDSLISKMQRFPLHWLEDENGKMYDVDGSDRIKYKHVKNGFQERNFRINPAYLRAFPTLHEEAMKRENISDLFPLMRYPLTYFKTGEVIYEMDLSGEKGKLELPMKINDNYASVFSRYAVKHANFNDKSYRGKSA